MKFHAHAKHNHWSASNCISFDDLQIFSGINSCWRNTNTFGATQRWALISKFWLKMGFETVKRKQCNPLLNWFQHIKIHVIMCSELHYRLHCRLLFLCPCDRVRPYLCHRVIIYCHLSLFYRLVWGYYNDCAVVLFSGVSWYILHSALQRRVKPTTRI